MDFTTYRAKAAEVAALEAEALRLDAATDAAAEADDRAEFLANQAAWRAAFSAYQDAYRAFKQIRPVFAPVITTVSEVL